MAAAESERLVCDEHSKLWGCEPQNHVDDNQISSSSTVNCLATEGANQARQNKALGDASE